ncbi:MAG: glycosyltransferase family 4 protein, partial [Phycisphaeraceae bacterium]
MKKTRRKWDSLQTVALLGDYLPRRCGIATFTTDLAEALAAADPSTQVWAVAMNDRPEGYRYPPRVWFEVNQKRLGEYRLAADFLNMSKADVVCVQHEYGIFGGPDGKHVLELLRRLRMPVVTTLHTVLNKPTDSQREVLMKIAESSDRLVVLADRAVQFLRDIYKVPENKIVMIPHGIPDVPFVDPNFYKDHFDVEGKKVILTFGLLSPSKGIENMIDAMPKIVAKHPDVVYIVLGATHPGVLAEQGEDYRTGLIRRAQDRGVADHLIFHNKFVELDELCEFLGAADVYVTPYHNETQIVSGTLAYALGSGKATVSTPYWYAQEMLAKGRGRIVPFKDPDALAAAIIELFDNEVERHAMRKRAYNFTRKMRWQEVACRYLDLFSQSRDQRQRVPKPIFAERKLRDKQPDLAEIKLDHLRKLTDDVSIFQHARYTVPWRHHGYCTDDNARGLIVAVMAQDHVRVDAGLDSLASRYLSFLDHALNEEAGRFRNFMGYDRRWLEDVGSEDSHGRAMWALGVAVARCQARGQMSLAMNLFHRALPAAEKFQWPHAWAYALIGIHEYLRQFGGDSQVRRVREHLAHRLFERFQQNARDDWPWPTNTVTYANARLPHALLLSGRWMFRNEMIEKALWVLEWLVHIQTSPEGHFAPVGCNGWFPRGGAMARFDQQPIEATSMIEACLEAHHVTNDRKWLDHAYRCLNWFLGDNDLRTPLYDHTTGGCHDGLHPQGVNENQGAESTLCWLLALLALYDHNLETRPAAGPQPEQA